MYVSAKVDKRLVIKVTDQKRDKRDEGSKGGRVVNSSKASLPFVILNREILGTCIVDPILLHSEVD